MTIQVTPELLARHDRPGPRYTSYPTAVEFTTDVGEDVYGRHLTTAARSADAPLSLYVHLPFCEHRCTFCACHVVIPRDRDPALAYLERLCREVELVAGRLGERRTLAQYHWGGGTPTFYSADELGRLQGVVDAAFERPAGTESSVEVDPRVTTGEHLEALRSWGFNRVSLGVQDMTPDVQVAIGRNQTAAETVRLLTDARRLGFESVNVDLVYGLPLQTPESFRGTLEQVAALRPDRLAVYSFAFVPWMKPHQRVIDPDSLPARDAKLEMLAEAVDVLTGDGYVWIGMDHFALPDDELVLAQHDGRLHRNFMGYTVTRAPDMIGVGASAIGDVAGGYFQNNKRLRPYSVVLDAGRLPVERGYVRTRDDDVRRHVIGEILCNRRVVWADVAGRFGVEPTEYFAAEIAALCGDDGAVATGLAETDDSGLRLTELGALFPRNVAMAFDPHMAGAGAGAKPVFSRTV